MMPSRHAIRTSELESCANDQEYRIPHRVSDIVVMSHFETAQRNYGRPHEHLDDLLATRKKEKSDPPYLNGGLKPKIHRPRRRPRILSEVQCAWR